jgi:hypothetical protein
LIDLYKNDLISAEEVDVRADQNQIVRQQLNL